MVAKLVARTALSDVSDSSVMKHLLAAAARQDDEQYYQMALLLQLFSIDKASGDDLDARAKDVQPSVITRIQAGKSSGTVVFSAKTAVVAPVSIPVGTKVKTASGDLFTTTAAGTILPTSPEKIAGHGVGRDSDLVPATADVPGSAGNVAANTIVKMVTKPSGVEEVTNPSAFANGRDKETDDAFRGRIKAFISSLPRSTVGAIEAGVLGIQDPDTSATVLFAKVVEDIVERGEVTLYIDDGTGTAESTALVVGENITLGIGQFDWQKGIITIPASSLVDGETVTIDDGINPSTVFEFDIGGGGVSPGNVAVVLVGTEDAAGVATALESAINGVGGTLEATASVSGNVITVNHDSAPVGVLTVSDTVADVGFFAGVISSALGGETTLYVDNIPIDPNEVFTVTSSVRGVLVESVDFVRNSASGQIDFNPALVAGEVITVDYTYFTGLIQYVQKVVDGDANDRANFPGLRAAGVRVTVTTPQVLIQNVDCFITVAEGYERDLVAADVEQAILDYINNLGISGDVVLAKLTAVIMDVDGVINVDITSPTNDIIILDDQLARTTTANITVR